MQGPSFTGTSWCVTRSLALNDGFGSQSSVALPLTLNRLLVGALQAE